MNYRIANWGIWGTYQDTLADAERLAAYIAQKQRDSGCIDRHATVRILRDDDTVAVRVRVWPS